MKTISAIMVVLFLASCGGMEMSGRSDTGSMGRSGDSGYPSTTNQFDPDDPYHGG